MKNKKTLNLISSLIAGFGVLGTLDVLPFLSQEISVVIIGFSAALTPLFVTIGDYLDNKKLDGSFKG